MGEWYEKAFWALLMTVLIAALIVGLTLGALFALVN